VLIVIPDSWSFDLVLGLYTFVCVFIGYFSGIIAMYYAIEYGLRVRKK
jgi:hypothetical protein